MFIEGFNKLCDGVTGAAGNTNPKQVSDLAINGCNFLWKVLKDVFLASCNQLSFIKPFKEGGEVFIKRLVLLNELIKQIDAFGDGGFKLRFLKVLQGVYTVKKVFDAVVRKGVFLCHGKTLKNGK